MYKTKIECAKYLKDKYGRQLDILLQEKKAEKGYKTSSLSIIKKEYDVFFNNMNQHLINESAEEVVLKTVNEYKILLDFIYTNGVDVLKLYEDLFINNNEYNNILTKINKKLPKYIVKYINKYLKKI